MARLDIRLSEGEKAQLQALADRAGKSLSEFVRDQVLDRAEDLGVRVDDLDRRVARLEEMAGL